VAYKTAQTGHKGSVRSGALSAVLENGVGGGGNGGRLSREERE